ncbi:MAG TPA: 3-dehydroquinate synthase [Planctomycetota bacterium]|nr:3-dehydroquinate synthase [Planctomycetota bacterium]
MREIPLLTSRIHVGAGLLAGPEGAIPTPATAGCILTDQNCLPYAKAVERRAKAAGIPTHRVVLPSGEGQKSMASAARLHQHLARAGMDRKSAVFAVGGGVITDLGGFVASTYMRGIRVYLYPTTLLGQVDAAIGGKTAVNLPQGKNLVGTFYQPAAVFCDPEVLRTLPPREYVSGLGEVVKYGMIRDAALFDTIGRNIEGIRSRDPQVLDEIVYRCIAIKADVVTQDERESGERAILNYGHTIGHALEAAGGYKVLQHGEAVSIGMEAEAILSMELGIAPLELLAAQNKLLKLCGLPTRVKRMPEKKVMAALKLDKKNVSGKTRFVLPESIGKVRWGVEVPSDLIAAALRTITA